MQILQGHLLFLVNELGCQNLYLFLDLFAVFVNASLGISIGAVTYLLTHERQSSLRSVTVVVVVGMDLPDKEF